MRTYVLAALLAAGAAQAGAAVTGSAFAEYDQGGQPALSTTDTTLPAVATQGTGSGGISNVDTDPLGDPVPGFARARQTGAGFSLLRADGLFFDPGTSDPGNTSDPAVTRNTLLAQTVFEETVTNTSGGTQSYAFDVFLKNMYVDLYDFAGAAASPNPFADPASNAIGGRVAYEVTVNGATIFGFAGEVWGGNAGITVDQSGTDGTAPDGTTVSSISGTSARSVPGSAGGIGFDSFFATLDAGSFADGETISLVATMTAEIVAQPFELGAVANIGDPNDLSATGTGRLRVVGTPPPPPVIPLPAGAWLLLGGLGALAALRRRAA